MNLEELKEQALDRLRQLWGQIRESSLYITLREKYDELTPNVQKIVNISAVVLAVLLVFSLPLGYLSSSSDNISLFEEYKLTLRDLLQVQREIAQAPDVQQPPPVEQVRARAQQIFTEAGLGADQIRDVRDADTAGDPPTTSIPASVSQKGVIATLLKLNLKQVLDISYQLQNIAANLYVTSMDMTANKEDNHYYDVIFRVVGFTVDQGPGEAPEAPDAGAKGGPPKGAAPPPPPGGKNK